MIPAECKCAGWGRSDALIMLGTHHPTCPLYNPGPKVIQLLRDLCHGMESWAADEDGIHGDVWDAYRKAKLAIGEPVKLEEA